MNRYQNQYLKKDQGFYDDKYQQIQLRNNNTSNYDNMYNMNYVSNRPFTATINNNEMNNRLRRSSSRENLQNFYREQTT